MTMSRGRWIGLISAFLFLLGIHYFYKNTPEVSEHVTTVRRTPEQIEREIREYKEKMAENERRKKEQAELNARAAQEAAAQQAAQQAFIHSQQQQAVGAQPTPQSQNWEMYRQQLLAESKGEAGEEPAPQPAPRGNPLFAKKAKAAEPEGAAPTGTPAAGGPSAPAAEATRPYTVRDSDSMFSVAATELGNRKAWRQLMQLNPQVRNPSRLTPGTVIRLPVKRAGSYD